MLLCSLGILQVIINVSTRTCPIFNGRWNSWRSWMSMEHYTIQMASPRTHMNHIYLVFIVIFFQIFICYVNLIVPQFDIKLVEVFCPIQSIQHIINAKHMIVNIYIYFIQGTIINTYSQLAILFINKQNMYPIRWLTLLNIPPIEEVI